MGSPEHQNQGHDAQRVEDAYRDGYITNVRFEAEESGRSNSVAINNKKEAHGRDAVVDVKLIYARVRVGGQVPHS